MPFCYNKKTEKINTLVPSEPPRSKALILGPVNCAAVVTPNVVAENVVVIAVVGTVAEVVSKLVAFIVDAVVRTVDDLSDVDGRTDISAVGTAVDGLLSKST